MQEMSGHGGLLPPTIKLKQKLNISMPYNDGLSQKNIPDIENVLPVLK